MTYHRHGLPGLIGIALLLACDGSKSAGPRFSAPGSSATAGDFCNSIIQNATNLQARCSGGGEAFWKDLYGQVLNCSQLAKDVAAGVLSYDAQKGAQCLEEMSQIECNQSGTSAACSAAITGHIPTGGSCSNNMGWTIFTDCAPGNYCYLDIAKCGGTCKPYAKEAESCAYTAASGSVSCANGTSCQMQSQVCVADVAEGQPCEGPTAGECADGLYCDGKSTLVPGVCRKSKTGGACVDASECANNHSCIGTEGSKTCRKMKLPGDSCTPGLRECFFFLGWCGSDGKCTQAGAEENQPCGLIDYEVVRCVSGLTCTTASTGSTATCQKGKPAGSPCTSGSECEGTVSYCDPATKMCVACN
jgi:hypothetical protein